MSTEFNSNFSLFPTQEKKSEKSPDFSGTIEIPVDQINSLVGHLGTKPESNYKDEPVVRLRVAGWKTTSKSGKNYVNGKVSIPMAQGDTPAQGNTANAETDLF